MTPYELRRRANRMRHEAEELEESTRVLRPIASDVRGLMAGLVELSRVVWRGPAAKGFEAATEERDARLKGQAAAIDWEADKFMDRASALRTEANRLIGAAAAAESVPLPWEAESPPRPADDRGSTLGDVW